MANSADAVVINNQTLFNVSMSNVAKLNNTKYLMWSCQVHALFDGYELAGFLDGSKATPAPTITTNGTTSANPGYTHWKRQDKLVYSALLGAISTSNQPLVSRATTSAQIWDTLYATYAKPIRGHVKQLKQQLRQWTKGGKSIDEYLQGLTTRFDQLAILGKPVDHEDQVEHVLEGLPEEYKQVVDQIEGKDAPPSLTEVHERLRNHEAKILAKQATIDVPVTANLAAQRNRNNTYNNNNNRNNSNRS